MSTHDAAINDVRLIAGVALMAALMLITGCSHFAPYPEDYPLIADKVQFQDGPSNKALTFAVTGERRFVMLMPSANGKLRVCAEPSPDLARAITSQKQQGASVSLGDFEGAEGATASGNALSYFATAALLLTQRSQGLQIYRDGMYYYCQMFIQGVISPAEYVQKENQLLSTAEKLIAAQIEHLPELQVNVVQAPPNGPALPPNTTPQPAELESKSKAQD